MKREFATINTVDFGVGASCSRKYIPRGFGNSFLYPLFAYGNRLSGEVVIDVPFPVPIP